MPSIVRYLTPWKLLRARQEQRLLALRTRDGDGCARCRRPLRFDLTSGHDLAPVVEEITPGFPGGHDALDNLRLCHRRCSASGVDHTDEVAARVRRKAEAALFAKSDRKRRAA